MSSDSDRRARAAGVRFEQVRSDHPYALASMKNYFNELDDRFADGFDPGDTLVTDAASMTAPNGAFVVAYIGTRPIACGGVLRITEDTAEIKRMWVDADWRGLGLGSRMLGILEAHAKRLGHDTVKLDTNGVLTEAIKMYVRSGYRAIERYNNNPYAQRWSLEKLLGRGTATT
jgi:GNAT superfamily N-acetyltransferase